MCLEDFYQGHIRPVNATAVRAHRLHHDHSARSPSAGRSCAA
jgi:hypothetical protein